MMMIWVQVFLSLAQRFSEGSPGMLLQSADSQAPTPETLVESGLMVGFRNLHFLISCPGAEIRVSPMTVRNDLTKPLLILMHHPDD